MSKKESKSDYFIRELKHDFIDHELENSLSALKACDVKKLDENNFYRKIAEVYQQLYKDGNSRCFDDFIRQKMIDNTNMILYSLDGRFNVGL